MGSETFREYHRCFHHHHHHHAEHGPPLYLTFHALPTYLHRAIATCHLTTFYCTSHFTASQRAFTLIFSTCKARARLVLGDLTLTEQLPTSPSPLLFAPSTPAHSTAHHQAQSLQVTSLFAHPHANTLETLHSPIRERAPSSFTALT